MTFLPFFGNNSKSRLNENVRIVSTSIPPFFHPLTLSGFEIIEKKQTKSLSLLNKYNCFYCNIRAKTNSAGQQEGPGCFQKPSSQHHWIRHSTNPALHNVSQVRRNTRKGKPRSRARQNSYKARILPAVMPIDPRTVRCPHSLYKIIILSGKIFT